MKLVIQLNSTSYLYDFKEIGVHDFIVGMKRFSCRQALSLDFEELKELQQKMDDDHHLFVLVNALIHEDDLEDLQQHLVKLQDLGVYGIYFQDFAVISICKKLNLHFELIYAPDTLNTSHATLDTLYSQGVSGFYLAREMSLDTKKEIAKKCKGLTAIQIHGCEYMAYSKRPLLTNYFSKIGKVEDTSYKANLMIKAKDVKDGCHIYEDQYGTHILSESVLCCVDILAQFIDFDYLIIDSIYTEPYNFLEIVNIYGQAMDSLKNLEFGRYKDLYRSMISNFYNGETLHYSFMYDDTVYKISDVRKREANEKH